MFFRSTIKPELPGAIIKVHDRTKRHCHRQQVPKSNQNSLALSTRSTIPPKVSGAANKVHDPTRSLWCCQQGPGSSQNSIHAADKAHAPNTNSLVPSTRSRILPEISGAVNMVHDPSMSFWRRQQGPGSSQNSNNSVDKAHAPNTNSLAPSTKSIILPEVSDAVNMVHDPT